MKPLKIDYRYNIGDEKEHTIFIRPDLICAVFDLHGKTAVRFQDGDPIYSPLFLDEPLLDFVKRWEEALADIDSRILMLLTRR